MSLYLGFGFKSKDRFHNKQYSFEYPVSKPKCVQPGGKMLHTFFKGYNQEPITEYNS
jgi:hypothetical protein